ncbi:MAG: phosphonopyruvate decarboxylase [Promethearchaeota archaeon]
MILCQEFFEILKEKGFSFFTGIPDSTFKEWIKFIIDNDGGVLKHIIACNECEAIALAAGYHLATKKIGVVYMQNSGLGKTVNPLTSLCDPDVYSIPILLMIGWRGEPETKDAPQHKKMGRITLSLLDTLQIPYSIIEQNIEKIRLELNKVLQYFKNNKGPYAFIIRPNLFQKYDAKVKKDNDYIITREEAINLIMDNLDGNEIIVSTTGYTSRELFEYRESRKKNHHLSFYNIGSMGCASSIGLSIALEKPNTKVIVFDGDAAAIMQMGAFTTIGKYKPSNFTHIIFDNSAHESTGGQPTNSNSSDLLQIALSCNYKFGLYIKNISELNNSIKFIKKSEGPIILIIKIKQGSRSNLKRPEKDPKDYKELFMSHLTSLK